MEFVLLCAGAILGVVFAELYNKIIMKSIAQFKEKRYRKMRGSLYRDPLIASSVKDYYIEKNAYDDLFDCEVQNYSGKALFLTNRDWSGLRMDIFRNADVLHFVDSENTHYEINNKMIRERKKYGQTLFDADCLMLSRVLETGKLEVKKCSFYEKLTLIDHLENETYKAMRRKHKGKLKYRDQMISDFRSALCTNNLPISMGCHVVLALKINGEILVALHTRSKRTFIYGGYVACIPVFGLVPIPSDRNSDKNNNVLFYNIIKEYCEELFNRTILVRQDHHTSPFWFYQQFQEAAALIESLEQNTSECMMLGYGFDAINGLSIIASLLYVSDEGLAKNIYDSCQTNWEVEGRAEFYKLDDPIIRENFEKMNYQNGTAFALSLAINYLKERVDL